MKALFPLSFKAKPNDIASLIIICVIYLAVTVLVGFVIGFVLGKLPIFGAAFSVLSALIQLYCLMGIVAAILVYMRIL